MKNKIKNPNATSSKHFLLHLLLLIALATLHYQCQNNPAPPDLPPPPSDLPPAKPNDPACLDFDALPNGATVAVGEPFLTTNLLIQQDDWPTEGYLKADSNNYVGNGRNLRIFNANVHMPLDAPVSQISFEFAELGGNNKMMINDATQNFADFPELQNVVIDGVGFNVDATQAGNNWKGKVTARGPIESFAIGGQELWIDSLCHERFTVLLDNRHENIQSSSLNPDGSINQFNNFREILTERGIFYTDKLDDGIPLTTLYLNQFDLYVWRLHSSSMVTMEELSAIDSFVMQGGALLILSNGGNNLNFEDSVLATFGVVHDDNLVQHPTSNFAGFPSRVIYTADNILDPAFKTGIDLLYLTSSATFSGLDESWVTVVESDAGATPPNKPVLIRKSHGNGKIMVAGNNGLIAITPVNVADGNLDNDLFKIIVLYFLVE